ncbi:hypothetical protein ACRALDRAFT_1061861 [Sodiomyces alcalophilus JCM 7366]|uniref:uncharacterized protein n=1 Tax=Sodiomyces alcalophilus JCM 7366 TaxID=591952 RepID=UPI0039B3ECEF
MGPNSSPQSEALAPEPVDGGLPPTKAGAKAPNRKPKTISAHKQRRQALAEAPDNTIIPPCGDPWPRPYYFEDGLRKVKPYHWTYHTFCKERWRGRTLLDVFECEFRAHSRSYYQDAIEDGRIIVNGKSVSPDYLLENGDLVNHTVHRHEPPVTDEPIGIIHEDDGILVVNKPAGMPVHPAGRYQFNSMTEILRSERGYHFNPRPCHRLDRLTSGILFFGKTTKAADALTEQIRERTVRKEYVARVSGRFPDGEIVCDQPILQISPRLGLNRVRANGKSARTVFKRLAYYPPPEDTEGPEPQVGGRTAEEASAEKHRPWINNKGHSIVRCLPLTGRTHQIRVHLQFLGHPIQNDPLYANRRVWGINLGCNDADGTETKDEDIMSRLERMGKDEVADAVAYHDEMVQKYHERVAEKLSGEVCDVCKAELYTDPGDRELSIWLHSLRYEDAGGKWSYVSPLPSWALPPSGMSGPTEAGGLEELVEAVKDEVPEIVS